MCVHLLITYRFHVSKGSLVNVFCDFDFISHYYTPNLTLNYKWQLLMNLKIIIIQSCKTTEQSWC